MVAKYYWTVRSILKQKPHLKKYLTRCKHCQILFFTHPRNAGRSDLGCPFGCREAHRQKESKKRSTEYYRTKEGRKKKKQLNANRSRPKQDLSCDEKGKDDFDTQIVCHIQLVTSLVEGRFVALAQVYAMLKKMLRQHTIDSVVKLAYAGLCHQENPP
ncbi:MAG: hypothetical protein PVI18_11150 [Desulfobacterales bacterium]|jgi:hypothetical protein